jgi:hypothetical protein
MRMLSVAVRLATAGAVATAVIVSEAPSAQARDFFSSFFGSLSGRPSPPPQPSFGNPGDSPQTDAPVASGGGRSMAYCVRTCDGRYFPISASSEQSRAATCNSLCPASETKVYFGSSIDGARSENGKPYSSLPNAFKYREQLVNGCTCNGKDTVGLASIDIKADKTLRRGDIVAGEEGLIVASRPADRKRAADFTPAPDSVRARFERSHAMMHAPRRKHR